MPEPHDAVVIESYMKATERVHGCIHHALTIIFLHGNEEKRYIIFVPSALRWKSWLWQKMTRIFPCTLYREQIEVGYESDIRRGEIYTRTVHKVRRIAQNLASSKIISIFSRIEVAQQVGKTDDQHLPLKDKK